MARSSEHLQRQPIRSFVLRKGRLTRAQQRALEEHWPAYGIEYSDSPVDFSDRFGRSAPLVMEIGFGNGAALAAMAAAEPEKNFIGVEVHKPGVGALLARVAAAGLANVRIISADVVAVLEHMIEVDSLAGVRLFFPDPWPKKRHHKRRLVQPAFLDMLAAKMRSGGLLHMATDWQNYSEQMLELLVAHPDFLNTAADNGFITRPEWRPLTHFEQRGTRLGHDVWDILFTRC